MTYTVDCELTDTFSGNANYSWVRRVSVELPRHLSPLAMTRRVKAALGINGMRGVWRQSMDGYSDFAEFRPYGANMVAFFEFRA